LDLNFSPVKYAEASKCLSKILKNEILCHRPRKVLLAKPSHTTWKRIPDRWEGYKVKISNVVSEKNCSATFLFTGDGAGKARGCKEDSCKGDSGGGLVSSR
jgi:hypothetical protein